MTHKRVAVLRGGPSEEHEVSLRSGKAVLDALDALGYKRKDVVISKQGEWLDSGVVRNPELSLEGVDVVFIALHGAFGEDGKVQRLLQRLNLPFTGTDALGSAIAFNKLLAKRAVRNAGVATPKHIVLKGDSLWSVNNELEQVEKELGLDLILKPISSGSSVGLRMIRSMDSLEQAISELLPTHRELLLEECIRGREATVGILENFREQEYYALPVIEIVPPASNPVFDYENKYNGKTEEICPGRFTYEEKTKLAELAIAAHKAVGSRQYSRSDFIVKDGQPYFLEINTLPGLTDQSLFPKAAKAIGLEFPDLIKHLVETARV